jgi:hypothetical protein
MNALKKKALQWMAEQGTDPNIGPAVLLAAVSLNYIQ